MDARSCGGDTALAVGGATKTGAHPPQPSAPRPAASHHPPQLPPAAADASVAAAARTSLDPVMSTRDWLTLVAAANHEISRR